MSSSSEDYLSSATVRNPSDAKRSDATDMADLNQMFVLIEGILPFEACLYYQVMPLSIEGSCLNLGMVNPSDQSAADYVRRLVSYINCSIVPRPITSDWHRGILSKFLSHTAKSRPAPAAAPPSPQPQLSPLATDQAFQEQPTLIVNSPADLLATEPAATIPAVVSGLSTPAPLSPLDPDIDPDLEDFPPVASLEALAHLSPKELTQELLVRVIVKGIGRLYLERQTDFGRILWSKDGVVQSILEEVSPQHFQGVMNELKSMMGLSLIPVRKPKQIEIERIYDHQRVLLRFRVMPGNYGEEATLQVLRGAALKFYQQQQIEKLGRDALGLAHTLQQRLHEIKQQARENLQTENNRSETLPAIISLLKQMEAQVSDMMAASSESPEDA